MGRIKSQLRFGLWPESKEREHHHVGLTVAARRLANLCSKISASSVSP